MKNIKMLSGGTFNIVESALGISKETGFKNVIKTLKEMEQELTCAGILVNFDSLYFVFSRLKLVEYNDMCRHEICFLGEHTDFVKQIENTTGTTAKTIQEAWNMLLYDLCENIAELYRYGLENSEKEAFS